MRLFFIFLSFLVTEKIKKILLTNPEELEIKRKIEILREESTKLNKMTDFREYSKISRAIIQLENEKKKSQEQFSPRKSLVYGIILFQIIFSVILIYYFWGQEFFQVTQLNINSKMCKFPFSYLIPGLSFTKIPQMGFCSVSVKLFSWILSSFFLSRKILS
ncbi:hypothetical protein M0811_00170 [Anaeramoeba ignava]|uniref:Tail-anchored protein insertion receptor WRB n=1 Tax=Anaeramoeba ignava TaxID=1746090 RepID=A0A9Q0LQ00_ANAIG|nr:hypothetical protein M0811_00170 [Anaeramoeba ignava]